MSSQTGNGPLTEYTYDLAGNILTMRVGGATTTFAYDNRGRLIRTTDALGQAEVITYDANSHVVTRTDRNGTLFRRTHDAMGRLVREEAVVNNAVVGSRNYTFHHTGALLRALNGAHSIYYYYDAQGRLIRTHEPSEGIVNHYTYNAANNRLTSRVLVGGNLHINNVYVYSNAQRLIRVYGNNILRSTYVHDANGRVTYRHLEHGASTRYVYNLAGLVTELTNFRRSNNEVLSRFTNNYYLDGNTHRVTELMGGVTRTITYTYDAARRLIREHDTGAGGGTITRAYSFDARGNRTQMVVTGAQNYTVTSTFDLNNRILTEVRTGSNPSTTAFTHDRNGNQLTRISGNQRDIRTYNAFNQLIETRREIPQGMEGFAAGMRMPYSQKKCCRMPHH